jgi:hypothetical protein
VRLPTLSSPEDGPRSRSRPQPTQTQTTPTCSANIMTEHSYRSYPWGGDSGKRHRLADLPSVPDSVRISNFLCCQYSHPHLGGAPWR